MRLKLRTVVSQSVHQVMSGFTEDLFLKLSPPFPPVKLLQFDGSRTGDVVSLELNFLFFRQTWTSHITHHEETADRFSFIDEGVLLPFFLGSWRHHHIIEAHPEGSVIIDDISFRGRWFWMTPLLYPLLFLQFAYRKPIYRRYFSGTKKEPSA